MPARRDWSSSVRDGLLVIVVATCACALGLVSSGIEFDEMSNQPADISRANSGRNNASGILGLGTTSRWLASAPPEWNEDSRARSPDPVKLAPDHAPSVAEERFSGEGGGRRQNTAASDPHSPRSYILDTAALMHRRGWIGLESRVAEATVGIHNPVLPAATRGPI